MDVDRSREPSERPHETTPRGDSAAPHPLAALARSAAATDPPEGRGASRLPFRVTRAQKIIALASTFGVVVALLVVSPPLPGPLGLPQQVLAWIGLTPGGETGARLISLDSAYLLTIIVQCNLLVLGAVWMWLVLSWRLARSPAVFSCGMILVALMVSVYLAASPTRTLVAWVAVAVLAIAYLHYWRKGRFGYTRGAAAAVFAHIALVCFFFSLPIVLSVVLVDVVR
jgi:O-antigen ligase